MAWVVGGDPLDLRSAVQGRGCSGGSLGLTGREGGRRGATPRTSSQAGPRRPLTALSPRAGCPVELVHFPAELVHLPVELVLTPVEVVHCPVELVLVARKPLRGMGETAPE